MKAQAVEAVEGRGGILVIAPLGRDAELACAMLTRAGLPCAAERDPGDLDDARLEALGALMLTEEVLTAPAVEALAARLDAQPAWSTLPVVLLMDPERRRPAAARGAALEAFVSRPGVVILRRPMDAASFVSVIRASALARRRQHQLRDELDARARAEARARTLADEMRHRVKNTLALAAGVASQTFRSAETIDEARQAFAGRLASMARAQDLLGTDQTAEVDLRRLVDQAVEPYRGCEEEGPLDVEGPPARIGGRAATALSMALHELATNAVKYGALSASGRVEIRWRFEETEDGGRRLVFEWRERGGPPVTPPKRRGFGSRLIERVLAQDLRGSARMTFEPEGVVCTIQAAIGGDGAEPGSARSARPCSQSGRSSTGLAEAAE